MQCMNRISLFTSYDMSLTSEKNVIISADKDLLLKTTDGSVKIEGSKLYDVNTESNYATTKDIETELANYATTEYVNSAIQNVSSGSIDESKFVKQPKILNADVLEDPAITYESDYMYQGHEGICNILLHRYHFKDPGSSLVAFGDRIQRDENGYIGPAIYPIPKENRPVFEFCNNVWVDGNNFTSMSN